MSDKRQRFEVAEHDKTVATKANASGFSRLSVDLICSFAHYLTLSELAKLSQTCTALRVTSSLNFTAAHPAPALARRPVLRDDTALRRLAPQDALRLGRHFASLQTLAICHLNSCPAPQSMEALLSGCGRTLRTLVLPSSLLSKREEFVSLFRACPNLEHCELPDVFDKPGWWLPQHDKLRFLSMPSFRSASNSAILLSACRNVERVQMVLEREGDSGEHLAAFSRLPSLRSVDLLIGDDNNAPALASLSGVSQTLTELRASKLLHAPPVDLQFTALRRLSVTIDEQATGWKDVSRSNKPSFPALEQLQLQQRPTSHVTSLQALYVLGAAPDIKALTLVGSSLVELVLLAHGDASPFVELKSLQTLRALIGDEGEAVTTRLQQLCDEFAAARPSVTVHLRCVEWPRTPPANNRAAIADAEFVSLE